MPDDYTQIEESLRCGLEYASALQQRGLHGPATHVAHTLHGLAPKAVPAPDSRQDLRRLVSKTKVHEGNAEGPLLQALQVHAGHRPARQALTNCLQRSSLRPQACRCTPEPWSFSLALAHHNDNAATLRDGIMRSDDGPTTTNSIEASMRRSNERWVLNIDHALFTERGGMHRNELLQASVRHLQTRTGRLFFDTTSSGWLVGVQGTGNFGGAAVQDGWHGLTGSVLGGRRLGAGLQDTYTSPQRLALLLGAELQGKKRIGLFETTARAQARVPVGGPGLGRATANVTARVGATTGPYASIGAEGGVQWTTGSAMNFDGAPIDGFFLSPRVGLGWEFGSWNLGLEWQGNRFATQPGMGDRDGESIGFTVRFGL